MKKVISIGSTGRGRNFYQKPYYLESDYKKIQPVKGYDESIDMTGKYLSS